MNRRCPRMRLGPVRTEEGLAGPLDEERAGISLEELERRLEAEILQAQGLGPLFCVWYTCPDVCPPGG